MERRLLQMFALGALGVLVAAPLGTTAATSGFAWDSVTKLVRDADPASLQPGSFDADYTAAAAAQTQPQQSGGSLAAKIKQAMAMGQNVRQMMETGLAERHYVAGSKERTDQVAEQTATIVDCSARTITSLDLRAKTYRVESLDAASSSSSGESGGGPQPRATDDNSRFAITITNAALGAKQVAGQPTNGFRSDVTFTQTRASGESVSGSANLIGYYTSRLNPALDCARGAGGGSHGPQRQMMAGYMRLMRALSSNGSDPRFTVKYTGPILPAGNLSMYDAVTFTGGNSRAAGATFVTERGNLRPIDDNDPVFSVPSDFTKQQ